MHFCVSLLCVIGLTAAYIFTESGDAGFLPATSQSTFASPNLNGNLDEIQGTLLVGDTDMYRINLPNGGSISITSPAPVTNSIVDPALFLFERNGVPIRASDPITPSVRPSLLLSLPAGQYLIAIAHQSNRPFAGGVQMYPTSGTRNIDESVVPLTSNPVDSWGPNTSPGVVRSYRIVFSGSNVWGDPHFTGFNGVSFEFTGVPNRLYSIYNDPGVLVNARFTASGNYTIMTEAAVRIGANPRSSVYMNLTHFDVGMAGLAPLPTLGLVLSLPDECVQLQVTPSGVEIYGPNGFSILVFHKKSYLLLDVNLPDDVLALRSAELARVGGLLGRTLTPHIGAPASLLDCTLADDASIYDAPPILNNFKAQQKFTDKECKMAE